MPTSWSSPNSSLISQPHEPHGPREQSLFGRPHFWTGTRLLFLPFVDHALAGFFTKPEPMMAERPAACHPAFCHRADRTAYIERGIDMNDHDQQHRHRCG